MNDKIEYFGKRRLSSISAAIGWAVVGFIFIQYALGRILSIPTITRLYYTDAVFKECVSLIIPLVSILVPFLLAGRYLQKGTAYDLVPLERPADTVKTLICIPAGVSLCLIGSFVSGVFRDFIEKSGVELTGPDLAVPESSAFSVVIYVVRLTVVAAFVEEICLRGVVMHSLRPYGDGFAIFMSALIFGLMHGNFIQAPFAVIAGVVIGYFTVVTGSLWTGIFIHLINNGISGVSGLIYMIFNEKTADFLTNVLVYFSIIFGLLCVSIYIFKYTNTRLHKNESVLPLSKRVASFVFTVPMVLAIVLILVEIQVSIKL